MALPKAPILFTKPRTALADPYPAVIPVPKAAQDGTSDYEAELCVVIGKTGRDIPEDKVFDYILGYTASNDVSARTMQMLTTQWSFSKGLDGSCPLGTCIQKGCHQGDLGKRSRLRPLNRVGTHADRDKILQDLFW